jgi:GntR family transcriptional regulator, transcriptional repressor for pyruvate dehydrogenase complex
MRTTRAGCFTEHLARRRAGRRPCGRSNPDRLGCSGIVQGVRATDVVLQYIEQQLEDGELSIGMRLPGERILAERLEVSRGSVREALQVLSAMGVVRRSVGGGQDSGATLIAEPAEPLRVALRLHVATRAFPVAQVVEARVLLESWAAAEAAKAGESLDEARKLLALMDVSDIDVREFLHLDAQLHVAIAALSGNAVIGHMMASLRGSIESYVVAAIPKVDDWPALMAKLRREHHDIVEAIDRADPDGAAAAVSQHIHDFYGQSGLQQP